MTETLYQQFSKQKVGSTLPSSPLLLVGLAVILLFFYSPGWYPKLPLHYSDFDHYPSDSSWGGWYSIISFLYFWVLSDNRA